jgi:hypothetical protein
MKQMRTIGDFRSPFFAQTQVTFDVYCYLLLLINDLLQNLFPFSTIVKFLPLLSIFKLEVILLLLIESSPSNISAF